MVAQNVPQIQLNFTRGIPPFAETFTFDTGTVVETQSTAQCSTGAGVFGYGLVRSKQWIPYYAGTGNMLRVSCQFDTAKANSLQQCGFGNQENAMRFGYDGVSFGTLIRTGGLAELVTFTITTHNNNSTISFDLNGVTYNITTPGTSEVANAQAIANNAAFGPDKAYVAEFYTDLSGAVKVIFAATTIDVKTFSSTINWNGGPGAGTFVQTRAGAPDVDDFVAQTDWNIDKMDGTGPSGVTLNPQSRNIYQIRYQWLGYGAIVFSITDPATGIFKDVHRESLLGVNGGTASPIVLNPQMQVEVFAANRGNGGDMKVFTSSMMAGAQGKVRPSPLVFAFQHLKTISTTTSPLVSYYVARTFNGKLNYVTCKAVSLSVSVAAGANEQGVLRLIRNSTLTAPSYQEIDADSSVWSDIAATASSGGTVVFEIVLAARNSETINLRDYNITWVRGEVFTIEIETANTNVAFSAALGWEEEQ